MRTGARVLRLVRQPAGIVASIRWLFLVCVLLAMVLTLPAPLVGASPQRLAMVAAACTVLATSWLFGYVTDSAPLWSDVVDAIAVAVFALASPNPATVFALVFSALWYRALYGSTRRSVLRCALYCTGISATLPMWALVPGHPPSLGVGPLIPPFAVMFVTVVVGRTLARQLIAREQAGRCDAAQVAVGGRLLGVTDTAQIFQHWWSAAAEICAAIPGLRVLLISQRGTALGIDGATGGFTTVPSALPMELVADAPAGSEVSAVRHPAALNDAVGETCEWVRVPLPSPRWGGWLLVGAPKQVPTEPLTALQSMINQVALALRNSEVHDELTVQARTDALTGLANRGSFASALTTALGGNSADHTAVLFLDLDDFKDVNDLLGHGAGDSLLRETAARLRRVTRPEDLCARLGGDEFAVLLHDTRRVTAEAVAQRLVQAVAAPVHVGNRVTQVGASVGVAHATRGGEVEELVQHADIAMYAAKANGKNQVQVFKSGLLQPGTTVSFERQLAAAAHAGQLIVHYQPILSLTTDRCTAVEALVRWQHPTRGMLQPADFVDLAEQTGAIIEIGSFVLRRACADAVTWRVAHPSVPLAVHVNVSAVQLDDERFIDTVNECIADHAMPAKQLVLEITESTVLNSPEAIGRLQTLARSGVTIALDDFGTGYSSLTTLRSLPVGIVKIDQSFVIGAATNAADQAVIEAIVQMAHRLGLRTIAEGVESPEQRKFLQHSGADDAQGFLYLRPSPAADFTRWLKIHRASESQITTSGAQAIASRAQRSGG